MVAKRQDYRDYPRQVMGPSDMDEYGGEEKVGAVAPILFVSYASQDTAVADTVVAALERAGIKCWIASRDVVTGALYADEIIAGGIVHHFGYRAGFLFLAAVALAALVILYFWMPETRGLRRAPAAPVRR
jgi:MFS family permease